MGVDDDRGSGVLTTFLEQRDHLGHQLAPEAVADEVIRTFWLLFRDRVDETGAFDETLRLAGEDAARASDAIMALPRGAWRDRLATLAASIVKRKR